jgi:hypothetical protein
MMERWRTRGGALLSFSKINFIMINAYLMIGDDLMVDNDDW